MKEIILQIKPKYDEVNHNGEVYSKEVFDKVYNDIRIKELIKHRMLLSEFGSPPNDADIIRFTSLDPSNSAGCITEIFDDSISLMPKNQEIYDMISSNIDNIFVSPRYLGNVEECEDGTKIVTNMKIITFDLFQED